MKEPRFKLISRKHTYNDPEMGSYIFYGVVDTKLSWRIADNISMQPDGEPALEVATAIVDFLNQRYGDKDPALVPRPINDERMPEDYED